MIIFGNVCWSFCLSQGFNGNRVLIDGFHVVAAGPLAALQDVLVWNIDHMQDGYCIISEMVTIRFDRIWQYGL